MIVVEIDLPENPAIRRRKVASLNELWELLPRDMIDYHVEQVIPNRFYRVYSTQQKEERKYLPIQGHWFSFDGSFPLDGSAVLCLQQDMNVSDTTAGTVWDGALLLAYYLPFLPPLPSRATVLELGAGCGLAGMATAFHCKANRLVLTDLPDQLERLHRNVVSNRKHLPNDTAVLSCDWFDPPDNLFPSDDSHDARIIVLADCVWMKELVQPLFETLEKYATPNTMVLVSYQTRGKDTDGLFWNEVRRVFSQIHSVPSRESIPIPPVFHLLCCSKQKFMRE